jgi:hypothetical protein
MYARGGKLNLLHNEKGMTKMLTMRLGGGYDISTRLKFSSLVKKQRREFQSMFQKTNCVSSISPRSSKHQRRHE